MRGRRPCCWRALLIELVRLFAGDVELGSAAAEAVVASWCARMSEMSWNWET